jgi:hypothetical protein
MAVYPCEGYLNFPRSWIETFARFNGTLGLLKIIFRRNELRLYKELRHVIGERPGQRMII